MFYEKYKATITGRLEGDDDRMEVFVEPWQFPALMAMALDNCKIVTVDGGIKAKEEGDCDDEF